AFNYATLADERSFAIVDTESFSVLTRNFITDGTDSRIRVPYGVAVNPVSGEIYVTDALNYVNPGQLYCFSPDGALLWEVRTGDVPSRFAFTGR
ncbi:MAG: YncE family protein, partial [Muribaculaceae bacterium]|nr:YncE family protein [Muribaculaceae bacterium]